MSAVENKGKAWAAIAALLVAGCAVAPAPMGDAEHRERAQADAKKMYAEQEPVTGPLTLEQAIARAVRYNMEYRLRMMEQAAALGQLEVANFDLLPKLTASAGYTSRNNDSFGFGFDPSGRVSTNPSASVERSHSTAGAAFSWNILDFGLSYVRAKQLADQSLIAGERRRKALQNLVQDVRQSFWRAHAAQVLLPEIGRLLVEIDQSSARAKAIAAQRLLPPLQIIAYRRSMVDLQQQLAQRSADLAQAKVELASLLNLPPGQPYTLDAPRWSGQPHARDFSQSLESLDALALEFRPELREEGYRTRVSDLEETRARLSTLLPGLSLDLGNNYDSNRFLLNNAWTQMGLSASANLLKLLSLPAIKRSADAQRQVDDARRLAQTAAVLTQIRLAVTRYELLAREYEFWHEGVRDDESIVEKLKASSSVGIETELELARAKARLINTRVAAALAFAGVEAAAGRIYNSVGLDSLPQEVAQGDVQGLTRELESRLAAWERTSFADRKAEALPVVALEFAKRVPEEARQAMGRSMSAVFSLSRISVDPGGTYRVLTDIEVETADDRRITARVRGRLQDASGKVISETEKRAPLTDPVTPQQWAALGETIGFPMVETILAQSARPLPKAFGEIPIAR